ncbi:TetR/AcrR family transcriptional regulator [Paenibacillus hodogayensis]|uniref:TetR/AcrR family transcriptional regulator n=1 Tax=Paenibacillus hodogayensis TaxID=279208 RepID=A0ABV5VST6_9BACL
MLKRFEALKPEKKDRIINAALMEFATKDYDTASTNAIVTEAEIGKGMLFHYFGSKKELYLFLYQHVVRLATEEVFAELDLSQGDLLIRWRHLTFLKLEMTKKHPMIFEFAAIANKEEAADVKQDIALINQQILVEYGEEKLFHGLDLTLFKEELDAQKAIHIIIWSIDGFVAAEKKRMEKPFFQEQSEIENMLIRMDDYISILRRALYKEAFH